MIFLLFVGEIMDWLKKIKEIKRNLSLFTSELARKLDMAPHYLSDLEREKLKNSTATLLELLLTNLGINPFGFLQTRTI